MPPDSTDTSNPYRRDAQILREIWQDQKQEGEEVFVVQRIAQTFVCAGLLISPATLARFIGSKLGDRTGRKIAIEAYVLCKVALMALLLFYGTAGWTLGLVAAAGLADLCLNLCGFVLLRHFWKKAASATRSIILLGFNFFELCLEFGILYLSTRSVGIPPSTVETDPLTILYFSFTTSSTVGYGDIVPISGIGRCIVMVQITISLAFVAVVLGTFVSNLSQKRRQES